MRKLVLVSVAAVAAMAGATSATAQYYPAPPSPAYGMRGDWGEVGALRGRIDEIRRQIGRLDRRDAISGGTSDRLLREADKIERRLYGKARDGLDPREAGDIRYRLQRLEQHVQFAMNDRFGRGGDRW
jgi:hypothetical protein